MKQKFILFSTLLVCCMDFSSCKKFLEIPAPHDQLISPLPFYNDATAIATVTGVYSEMMKNANLFSSGLITLYGGLSADELYYYTPGSKDEFLLNQITEANHPNISAYFWEPAYRFIYAANLIIEQVNKSSAITATTKNMLLGEAKFIRAFCYFNLVNLFGDVPLTTASDYRPNGALPRSPVAELYIQIVNDLKDAQNLLTSNYPSVEKTRPNKWAATALLARVYLYKGDWINAEAESTSVINSGSYSLVTNLNNVFLKNSAETIWQLMPVNSIYNTWEGNAILPATTNSSPTYLLTAAFVSSFETNDRRKIAWVASRTYQGQTLYYPYKYKVFGSNAALTEYYTVLRLAEQYLIRAEARTQRENLQGALEDLNVIRNRAGLPNATTVTKQDILMSIEQERKTELFAEWGHRWFDLKRTNRANEILGALKPQTWQSSDVLWPIPVSQINLNHSLTQNPGY